MCVDPTGVHLSRLRLVGIKAVIRLLHLAKGHARRREHLLFFRRITIADTNPLYLAYISVHISIDGVMNQGLGAHNNLLSTSEALLFVNV